MTELLVHEACRKGKLEVLEEAVEAGCDPRERGLQAGTLPLHWACHYGHLKCADYLLRLGLNDINCRNDNGNTPLHYATIAGRLDVVEFLVKNAADVNIINNDGQSPLHGAVGQGWYNVVKYLVTYRSMSCRECRRYRCRIHQVDINSADCMGTTPLHIASTFLTSRMYDLLVRHGADTRAVDVYGRCPISPRIRRQQFIMECAPFVFSLLFLFAGIYVKKCVLRNDVETVEGSTDV
ncbi:hypothetical protein CBR_g9115 [Chara braunii]|uniref:Uncharacterized protein n=1 Tax=Chara braunii TaxID=69332 RepID=A0A388KP41_CHABU|nr:hypothetical protein CBR_g9115 [Chara braunii]|eukprot:GBG71703.1 hypothetical protein CBR_g9115 [Chara braunii]